MNEPSRSVQSLLNGEVAVGSTVLVRGWLRSRRTSKAGISFLAVHDGSGFDPIQAVAPEALDNYEAITQLGTGAAVEVEGTLVESQGKGQSVEIQASRVRIVGPVIDPEHYPIAKKRHTFEYLRGVAHLRPRTNTLGAIARLRHQVSQAIHRFFDDEGFLWVHTPLITAADAEGAGELFRVTTLDPAAPPTTVDGTVDWSRDFFGKPTFLTVSGQLDVEAYCLSMGKVYTFGPTFRAENSHTSRHLAEFWMVEPEIAFADLDDLAALAERFLKSVIRRTLDRCDRDLRFFAERIDKEAIERMQAVERTPFARMSYTEAIDVLERSGKAFEFPVAWGKDLQSEHERYLCEEHVGGPVVVTDYPADIKAFYMRRNDDGRTVAAMDVLVPGVGEIIGGSQREERLEMLEPRMQELGIARELDWYLDLRRYGTAEHAGFGLGLERLLLYFTGMENIRDVIPFPRVPGNADF